MNQVNLIGRLTKDVELTLLQGGKAVAKFSVAINNGKDRDATFINCEAWDKTASVLQQYTSKGSQVALQGRIATNKYQAKDGREVTATFVSVSHVELLDSKKSEPSQPSKAQTPEFDAGPEFDINIDGLPF